jgi:hypothetical protein
MDFSLFSLYVNNCNKVVNICKENSDLVVEETLMGGINLAVARKRAIVTFMINSNNW